MATVILTYPLGTYQTDALGGLVPFTATGYVDVPGHVVAIYDDGTGALLGSVNASIHPQLVGDYPGWYSWSIPILSWAGSNGAALPAATASASAGGLGFTAALVAPAATATTEAGASTWAVGTTFVGVPAATAVTAAAGVSLSAVGSLPAATATASAGGISLSAPGSQVFGNGDFELPLAGSLGFGNWLAFLGGGGGTEIAERTASAITGSYSGRLRASGFDDGLDYGDGYAELGQKVEKSELVSTPTLSFKCRNAGATGAGVGVGLTVKLYDAGNVDITNTTGGKNSVKLWGNLTGPAANTTIAFVPSGATVYDKTFGLNAFVETCLAAGKVVADISYIKLSFTAYADTSGAVGDLAVDNVALGA